MGMSTSVPMASNELARRTDGTIEFRAEPIRVRLELSAMQSRDHHDVRCTLNCSVRIAENQSDRRLLGEVLLADRNALHREDVSGYLANQIRARIESFVGNQNGDDLLSGAARGELLKEACAAADAAAFACGLIVLPPYQLDVQSDSVQRGKIEQMQRARAEARSADQVEHLRRAGELLRQFQSVRESSNGISPGRILEQIAPADRGSTLEALLAASSQQAGHASLWAVAGPYLVRIDPGETAPKVELLPLPATLGPLRSVQPANVEGKSVLLIGARNGFMLAERDRPIDSLASYADTDLKSELGFNRVALWSETAGFLATHADGGLVGWNMGADSSPGTTHRDFGRTGSAGLGVGARHLQTLDHQHAVFSTGNQLVVLEAERHSSLPAESTTGIVSIILTPNEFFAVHEDGLIVRYDRASREVMSREHRGGRLTTAAALPWLGSVRLLLAREDGAIECAGVEDQLITQYLSAHRGYKMLAANAAVVAAVSSDRQRLILWHSWDGRKPFAELHLTSQTRHRIADIEFG
ncbi:hypothetical protein BH09PLA1_BH09PLA1_15730 [soil metagenome]